MSRNSKFSLFAVFVAFAVLMLANIACSDTGSVPGGNGCSKALVDNGKGQLVCPQDSKPFEYKAIEGQVQAGQQVYDKAVDKAASAAGQSVQGSQIQKAVGAVQSQPGGVWEKGCGFKGTKPGSNECNP